MSGQKQIRILLEPLFFLFHKRFHPASEKCLAGFRVKALKLKIPDTAVEQLTDLYKVTNGVSILDEFTFHRCGDNELFEWWNKKKELWLGSREIDILRWKNGKFCLGDANTISYSAEYECQTLSELLVNCFNKWYFGLWNRFVDSNKEMELWRTKTNGQNASR